MSADIRFKFKYLTEDGQEAGFLSKKGMVTTSKLVLDKEEIPIEAVLRAQRRLNRLLLSILQNDGSVGAAAFAVTSRNLDTVLKAINGVSSRRWAEIRRKALAEKGDATRVVTVECPYCNAVVDTTGFAATPQFYCDYCETIVTRDGKGPRAEPDFRLCDVCGYFSRPRPFTTFYFYFLFVVYGYRYQRRTMCPACMRGEAWKMFFANLPFVLGFPSAVVQLFRAYLSDRGKGTETYSGINRANSLARRKQTGAAAEAYASIARDVMDSAGIRFNCGKAFGQTGGWNTAAKQLESALVLCSNHVPSYRLLCECYENLRETEKLAALRKQWGDEKEQTPPAPAAQEGSGAG